MGILRKKQQEKQELKNIRNGFAEIQKLKKEGKAPNYGTMVGILTNQGIPINISNALAGRISEEQEKQKAETEKTNIQNAFNEVLKIRNETGDRLPTDQLTKIFADNKVPSEKAIGIIGKITTEGRRIKETGMISKKESALKKWEAGEKLDSFESALVGKSKEETIKVDWYEQTKKGQRKRSKIIPKENYNDFVQKITDSGGRLGKPGERVNKHGLTAKEQFAHNRGRIKFVEEGRELVEPGQWPMERKKRQTEYDARVFGWEPTRIRKKGTDEIIEGYKSPSGFVDLWGKTPPAVKPEREKGGGFFGTLKRPDGGVSTEISIGVNFGGEEIEIPSLVPTLTKSEINHLLNGKKPTKTIIDKAVSHAKDRIAKGKDPFWQAGEPKTEAEEGLETEKIKEDAKKTAKKIAIKRSQLIGSPPEVIKAEREAGKQEMVNMAKKLGFNRKTWNLYKDVAGWLWGGYSNFVNYAHRTQRKSREALGK